MNKIIYILLFLTANFSFSQSFYEAGEIFYRDGTSEKGYLKIKSSIIKFKKKNTAKKSIELTYKKVKSIIINEDGTDYTYIYKIIKGKKKGKVKLLKSIISGNASLYVLEHETYLGSTGIAPISINLNYKGGDFYVGKNNSSLVNFIGANSMAVGRKSIRKGLLAYFKECTELIKK